MRVRGVAVAVVVMATLVVPLPNAWAATISVDCGDVAGLRKAIITANTHGTPDGTTIELGASCVYTITEAHSNSGWGPDGLPAITAEVVLTGNGATIQRDPSLPDVDFRIFHVADARVTISDLNIESGRIRGSNSYGGAGILNRGSLVLQRVALERNVVVGGVGGAIDNRRSLWVEDSSFVSNMADGRTGQVQVGGAIRNGPGARVDIFRSRFFRNQAAVGGAILNVARMVIIDSVFDDNAANLAGAIDNRDDGTLAIGRSFFVSNEAWDAGAIRNSGHLEISNSTLRANEAVVRAPFTTPELRDGAAMHNSGFVNGAHLTFSGNRAANGASIFTTDEGTSILANSIIEGGASLQCYGPLTDAGYNLVWPADSTCPATATTANPKLLGPSRNGAPQSFNLSQRLGGGSAAIDLIPAASCSGINDQRGFARPQGSGCDAGAYENQLPTTPGAPGLTVGSNPSKDGTFTLGWTASEDGDPADTISYDLLRQDGDDPAPSLVATTGSTSHAFDATAPEDEGTFRYFTRASDGNASASLAGPSGPVVVDKTAPDAPAVSADRAPDFIPSDGGAGWYRDGVTVTFTDLGDPRLPDGSPGSGVAVLTEPQAIAASGSHVVSGSATDRAGNSSPISSLTVNVDADAPAVTLDSCPGEVLLGSSASAGWAASDAESGLATPSGGQIDLDTATVGTKAVSVSARDNVHHDSSASCDYRVVYDFTGFFDPIKNHPEANRARAGRVVPISFSLGGDQGLGVLASDYPHSAEVACGTVDTLDEGAPTLTSARGLTFAQSRGGRYTYHWQTLPEWSGTCRQFILQLRDGTFHRATFSF